ncbi:MAG: hypothetical protein ACIAQU_10980 [Phycisphaerales bacterium JB064]
MSKNSPNQTSSKKPGALRQVATLVVALAIAGVAAMVILPKLQGSTSGPVRLDIINGTQGSMLELELNLRVPASESVGTLPTSIAMGGLVTAYEGLGPVRVESIGYVSGADGNPVTHRVDATIEPGGTMVLRVRADGVAVDATEAPPEMP